MPYFTRSNGDEVHYFGPKHSSFCNDPCYRAYQALNGPRGHWPAYIVNPTGVILNLVPGEEICRWQVLGMNGLGLCGRKGVDLYDHNLHMFKDHVLPMYGRCAVTPDIMKSRCKDWNGTMTRGFYCQLMGHAVQAVLPGAAPQPCAPARAVYRALPLAPPRGRQPPLRRPATHFAQPTAGARVVGQQIAAEARANIALIQSGDDLEDEAPPRSKKETVKQEAGVTVKEEAAEELTEVKIKKETGDDEESLSDDEGMDGVKIKKEED